jgi:hypothetical protein
VERLLKQFVQVALVVTISCADSRSARTDQDVDLSTPAATVLSYCNADDLDRIRSCFESGTPLEMGIAKRIWSSCRIVSVGPAKIDGGSNRAKHGDVEVVIEVRMIDPDRGNPLTRFWYLLREKSGQWKIISNAHIADDHYPMLD